MMLESDRLATQRLLGFSEALIPYILDFIEDLPEKTIL